MTSPKRASIDVKTGMRVYASTEGKSFPSVTSVLSIIAKPYLVPWAAKVVAETAVEVMQDILDANDYGASPHTNYLEAFWNGEEKEYDWDSMAKCLKNLPNEERDDAGSLGDVVHDVSNQILRLSHGAHSVAKALFDDMVDSHEIAPPVAERVQHLITFLKDHTVIVVADEFTIYNDKYGYAGSCDVAAFVDGIPYFIDLKTNRQLGKEIALQITAYSRGEYVVADDNTTHEPMPFSKEKDLTSGVKGAIIHLQATQCKFQEVNIGDEIFDAFLAFHLAKRIWFDDSVNNAFGEVLYKSK